MGKKMLLLGVYGMEMVECGGALLKNALNGGESYASLMLAGEKSRPQVLEAAKILKTEVTFLEYKFGEIMPTPEQKLQMIRLIRKIQPDVIITQDTEHCISDLDPDRREAMTLILESIALASRNYELAEGEKTCPIPEIYFMTPNNPNCLLNIADVWEEKQASMDCLTSQIEFSAAHYEHYYGQEIMEKIVPGWSSIDSMYEKGRRAITEFNKAYYLSNGSYKHSHFAFAETYRKEGMFHLEQLS